MRETSARSLCAVIIVSFSLMSLGTMTSLEDSADSGWQTASLIETEGSEWAIYPQVAVDDPGNAIVVWQQTDPDNFTSNIWWNRYDVISGWETAAPIQANLSQEGKSPQVAIGGSGNAIAVWEQGMRSIWSSRYEIGRGWETAKQISADEWLQFARLPQVAIDNSGNAIAVWEDPGYIVWGEDGVVGANIWSNRYAVGSGWDSAMTIDTDGSGTRDHPQVAADDAGNAIVVWQQNDELNTSIWSNRFAAGLGWGNAELLDAEGGIVPQISMDGRGNAVAVWLKSGSIWSSRYAVDAGWSDVELIEAVVSGNAQPPQVAIDGSGNAIAVWSQSDDLQKSIWSNRYIVGLGWGTAALIETNDSEWANNPQISVDHSGNAIAVWRQANGSALDEDTRLNIWSNRYVVGTGWGNATVISTYSSRVSGSLGPCPQVAINPSGNAIAVWSQWDGNCCNVWSSRYVDPDSSPLSLASTVIVALVAVASIIVIFAFWFRRKNTDRSSEPMGKEEPPRLQNRPKD